MFLWCLQSDQKINEIFVRISALAFTKSLNQKNKGTLYLTQMDDFILTLFHYFFELLLETRAEISLVYWSIWRHQYDNSKLTDLYRTLFRMCT